MRARGLGAYLGDIPCRDGGFLERLPVNGAVDVPAPAEGSGGGWVNIATCVHAHGVEVAWGRGRVQPGVSPRSLRHLEAQSSWA